MMVAKGPYVAVESPLSPFKPPSGEPPLFGKVVHKERFRTLLSQLTDAFEEQGAELSLALAEVTELRGQLRGETTPSRQDIRRESLASVTMSARYGANVRDLASVHPDLALEQARRPGSFSRRATKDSKVSKQTTRGMLHPNRAATLFGGTQPSLEDQDRSTSDLSSCPNSPQSAMSPLPLRPEEVPAAECSLRQMTDESEVPGVPKDNIFSLDLGGKRRRSAMANRRASRSSAETLHNSTRASTITQEDMEEFNLRPEWEPTQVFRRIKHYAGRAARPVPLLDDICLPRLDKREQGCMRHFLSMPGSRGRIAWDALGALLIIYDLVVIPLRVFPMPSDIPFIDVMDWITILFWTVNMPASCLVGFVKRGVVEMRFHKIVKHYLRSWFFVDLVVVVLDWISSLSAELNKQGTFDSVTMLRALRLARAVRLLRVLKLRWLLQSFDELLDSEFANIMSNIAKVMLALLALNHFLACGWFGCALLQEDHNPTWLDYHGFRHVDWGYQYLTSLHWSLTQFTPASMHVQPQNSLERAYTVTVVVLALVVFSYLVGSITGSLTKLRALKEEAHKQFWHLRRFLRQKKVPLPLAMKIEKYVEHIWQRQQEGIGMDKVKLLELLSEQLFLELQSALYVPTVVVHPLFKLLSEESSITMHRLANEAMSQKQFAEQDLVFLTSEVANHVYFVSVGRLVYCRVDSWGEERRETVDGGEDWIAEPILWTPEWRHIGNLVAEIEVDMILIEACKFLEVMQMNPAAYTIVVGYARNFLNWMNNQPRTELSDISQGELVSEELRSFLPDSSKKSSPSRSMTTMPGLSTTNLGGLLRSPVA